MNYKNVSIFCSNYFKKNQNLFPSFRKCLYFSQLSKILKIVPNLENILVLAICSKIENNICTKERHFLKFLWMFKTCPHLKICSRPKTCSYFYKRFMFSRNLCEIQEMFRSYFLFFVFSKNAWNFQKKNVRNLENCLKILICRKNEKKLSWNKKLKKKQEIKRKRTEKEILRQNTQKIGPVSWSPCA